VDKIAQEIGNRLKETRKAQGKTQFQVAWPAGCSIAELSQYEHGLKLPQVPRLLRLAESLGISIADLVPKPEKIPAEMPEPGTDHPPAIVPGSFSESDQ
jgi:transcriptional regulator with XRE-family HTH domain